MKNHCPADSVLQALLDSALPEPVQIEVVAHLDSCTTCQHKLENIAAGNSSVLAAAKSAVTLHEPEATSAYWPALERVERELHGAGTIDLTHNGSGIASATVDLSFLEPAEDGKHLGMIDRFVIVELIGRGGMGMVFRAYDQCLQRTVAIKLLDQQYAKNEMARGRFLREARAAAGVAHENVVTIHHVDCLEDRDLSFMVMQYVRGRSLQDRLDEGGALPVREAVRIAAATASGLAAAHATNLIHRDIKPGNILIEHTTGRVLLTDFGLARLTENVKLTQTGFVAGTPLYMSPEQARGESVDHRSDLFSLGGVLYTMLAGTPPFPGSSAFAVLKQVTDSRHKSLHSFNPTLPNSLVEIVDRLLEKNPRHRFPDAAAVAAALQFELTKWPADSPSTLVGRRTTRLVPRQVRSWVRRYSTSVLIAILGVLATLCATEATKVTRWTILGQRGQSQSQSEALTSAAASAAPESVIPTRYTLPSGEGAVWAVAFDPCGELIATATEGGSVQFWDAREGHIRGVLNNKNYKSPVWSIAFNKDGTQLVTASDDGVVRLWDVKTKQEAGFDFKHPFPARCVAFSPDGKRLVTGTRNGAVAMWDVETGKKVYSTNGHDGGVVMAVAFSADSRLIASAGSDKTVRLWDAEDGSPRATLANHTGPVYAVAFDPVENRLASAGWDRTIRIWDANTSEQLKVYESNQEDTWSIAFCPEGKCLLAGGQDGTARWVRVDNGEVMKSLNGGGGPVHAVAVSKDGSMIAAGSRDGTVRVWDTGR